MRPDGAVPNEPPDDAGDDDCAGGAVCSVGPPVDRTCWTWPKPACATLAENAAREPVEIMRRMVTCIGKQ
jgi:hypothetical protein